MHLYQHKIKINGYSFQKDDLLKLEGQKQVKYVHHTYKKEKEIIIKDRFYLLWFKRLSQALKEGERYYRKTENGDLEEIDETDYEDLKREYNYFTVINSADSTMYTYNTTDTQKNTPHRTLLARFLGAEKIDTDDIIDIEEFDKLIFKDLKITMSNVNQMNLVNFDPVVKKVKSISDSEYDYDNLELRMYNNSNKSLLRRPKQIKKLREEGVEFYIKGIDEDGTNFTMSNEKTHKKIKLNNSKVDHTNPERMFEIIEEYFEKL